MISRTIHYLDADSLYADQYYQLVARKLRCPRGISAWAAALISVSYASSNGRFGFPDARNARASGTKRLKCEFTLRDSEVVWDLNGRAGEDWRSLYNKL